MAEFESVTFVNASGTVVKLSDESITDYWELLGRSGFTAPEIELITQTYANGVTKILKRKILPRTVSMNMVVVGATKADRDAVFFQMIHDLMDVDGGDIGQLYIKRTDGTTVYLNCAYSSGLNVVDEYRKFHKFTLEFYAADPYFYNDIPDFANIAEGKYLTLSETLLFGTKRIGHVDLGGTGVIVNHSAEETQPIIKVSSATGQLTISNETNGHAIILTGLAMADDQVLVLDTRDATKSIYILNGDGTTEPAGQYLDWENLDFDFPLTSGSNVISYLSGVGSKVSMLTISASERYLSA